MHFDCCKNIFYKVNNMFYYSFGLNVRGIHNVRAMWQLRHLCEPGGMASSAGWPCLCVIHDLKALPRWSDQSLWGCSLQRVHWGYGKIGQGGDCKRWTGLKWDLGSLVLSQQGRTTLMHAWRGDQNAGSALRSGQQQCRGERGKSFRWPFLRTCLC